MVEEVDGVSLVWGDIVFQLGAYSIQVRDRPSLYLVIEPEAKCPTGRPPLVRLHSGCAFSELFGDSRCDCTWQLYHAMRLIAKESQGLIIYALGEEGRGAGFINKMRSYLLMDRSGLSSAAAFRRLGLPVDLRNFEGAVAVLKIRNIRSVRLITNNPQKVAAVASAGIQVAEVISTVIPSENPKVIKYLNSKRDEMGHFIV